MNHRNMKQEYLLYVFNPVQESYSLLAFYIFISKIQAACKLLHVQIMLTDLGTVTPFGYTKFRCGMRAAWESSVISGTLGRYTEGMDTSKSG